MPHYKTFELKIILSHEGKDTEIHTKKTILPSKPSFISKKNCIFANRTYKLVQNRMKNNKLDDTFFEEETAQAQNPFSVIADFDGDDKTIFDVKLDKEIPILPIRNMVLFPGVVMPISVGRKKSLELVKDALSSQQLVGVVCQRTPHTEDPIQKDLYPTGTVAKVIRTLELPDNTTTVILQGTCRFRLQKLTQKEPYLKGTVRKLREKLPHVNDTEYEAIIENCKDATMEYMHASESNGSPKFALLNIKNKMFLMNFICANLPFPIAEKEELLELGDLKKRGMRLLSILNREAQFADLKAEIQSRTREDLNDQQREYFLQQQIRNLQEELGSEDEDSEEAELKRKAKTKDWPEKVAKTFNKELDKLSHISPQSPDYNVQLNYLTTVVSLPWNYVTKDSINLKNAERILNRDHYGMEKVKERILEHLAVLKMKGDMKSPILCLFGPPGVGKTSLGKSIAEALKRKYVRVSLGGVHDEAEIRGHRKTYIGAMPGRVIKGIAKAETSNPVFILDEIDKVQNGSLSGDPASALLEVLDPEQNNAFHDNFLDLDYDLSKVMFIATANSLNTIPQPLLDRMELIEVSGYITEEKIEIAKRHLIPRISKELGMDKFKDLKFTKTGIEKIIDNYTRESGVRQLEKKIGKIFRKLAMAYVKDDKLPYTTINSEAVRALLGTEEVTPDKYQGNADAGVVTGLAWTSVGGEILFIETSLSRGKGGKLTLTGNLGNVMKESAVLALEYVKAHADYLKIDPRIFDNWNIHIHVPEGAVPKDGPSAGITIATSLASALTQRKVRRNVAMTGEITLRGKVLPVGGIKEKILAAKRAGITDIVMSKENQKDIDEINDIYLKGLTFHYVEHVKEVWDFALLRTKIENPVDLEAPIREEEAAKKKQEEASANLKTKAEDAVGNVHTAQGKVNTADKEVNTSSSRVNTIQHIEKE